LSARIKLRPAEIILNVEAQVARNEALRKPATPFPREQNDAHPNRRREKIEREGMRVMVVETA
jgi:hypothetical protein